MTAELFDYVFKQANQALTELQKIDPENQYFHSAWRALLNGKQTRAPHVGPEPSSRETEARVLLERFSRGEIDITLLEPALEQLGFKYRVIDNKMCFDTPQARFGPGRLEPRSFSEGAKLGPLVEDSEKLDPVTEDVAAMLGYRAGMTYEIPNPIVNDTLFNPDAGHVYRIRKA